MNDFQSDHFESLTTFHKPIWVSKYRLLTESHVGKVKQTPMDMPLVLKNLLIYDNSETMEVDEQYSFENYDIIDAISRRY